MLRIGLRKWVITAFVALTLIFSLTSCGSKSKEERKDPSVQKEDSVQGNNNEKKTADDVIGTGQNRGVTHKVRKGDVTLYALTEISGEDGYTHFLFSYVLDGDEDSINKAGKSGFVDIYRDTETQFSAKVKNIWILDRNFDRIEENANGDYVRYMDKKIGPYSNLDRMIDLALPSGINIEECYLCYSPVNMDVRTIKVEAATPEILERYKPEGLYADQVFALGGKICQIATNHVVGIATIGPEEGESEGTYAQRIDCAVVDVTTGQPIDVRDLGFTVSLDGIWYFNSNEASAKLKESGQAAYDYMTQAEPPAEQSKIFYQEGNPIFTVYAAKSDNEDYVLQNREGIVLKFSIR